MANLTRREFFKRSLASTIAGGIILSGAEAFAREAAGTVVQPVGSVIDLSRCDGCKDVKVPRCVQACRDKNQNRFPEPVKDILDYWPQKKHEDWSKKRHLTDRLTPYNWTFVQEVQVEHNGRKEKIYIPRRCMHCDNPPCAKLCPFSAQQKTPEGPVLINPNICFGGAKCRTVCPWHIPQRQAGVGLYLKVAPKFAGGGVMYKCDLCYDRLLAGKLPACAEACPNEAITFGPKEEMRKLAHQRAKELDGFIYGEKENGGTSTFYVSSVPFQKIHQAIMQTKSKAKKQQPGIPGMPVGVENYLETPNGMAWGFVVAPLAGAFAAGYAAYRTMKGGE
ncbi:4Fe-4S dicluster domain-containing protein [Calderihabitans maritimus]|uniref:4Fe-4S ferredoxin n=1 Tax=Calderihabitans maritimus TaxID=1246530 RepID=A0A1Z5HPN4_9FIRM|nr:4Fe-4S dicluster domain-containing protein [Calderihabitans maritimus]GAW91496.1 4Fe-4S ferredoxin [Calderihabitans maritimus]